MIGNPTIGVNIRHNCLVVKLLVKRKWYHVDGQMKVGNEKKSVDCDFESLNLKRGLLSEEKRLERMTINIVVMDTYEWLAVMPKATSVPVHSK